VGDVSDAQIQSSVALEGQRSLEISGSSTGSYNIGSTRTDAPQLGDTVEYNARLTHTADIHTVAVLVSDASTRVFDATGLTFRVQAEKDKFIVRQEVDGDTVSTTTVNVAVDNHLNETLTVEAEFGLDGSLFARLLTSTGSELTSLSTTVDNRLPQTGAVQYEVSNFSVAPTLYFDGPFIDRRLGEETRERQRGSTETSKLQTRGGVGAGPPSATPNQRRRTTHRHPVTTDAQQGQRYVDAQTVGGSPVAYVEGQFDGNGGSYNDRFQTATGSFTRINERLLVKTPTFADTDYTFAQSASSHSASVTGRPRQLQLSHDGSADDERGTIKAPVLITPEELSAFSLAFDKIDYSSNDTANGLVVGFSSVDLTLSAVVAGDGIIIRQVNDGDIKLTEVSNGNANDLAQVSLSFPTTLRFAFTGEQVELFADGELKASAATSVRGDFTPLLQLTDSSNNTVGETVTVDQITVSPLTEVLR